MSSAPTAPAEAHKMAALPPKKQPSAEGVGEARQSDADDAADAPLPAYAEEDPDADLGLRDPLEGGGYTPYLARLSLIACLSGLQFGMDTASAAGMLVAIKEDLGHVLSSGEQELIVSATTVGAIVGSLVAGRLADWAGRKKVLIAAAVCFLLGSLEQAASQVVRELALGRLIQGAAVGLSSTVIPTLLGELAPPSIRGRLIGLNGLLITGGQLIAYAINALFYLTPHGWRWMVLSGAVPAVIQLVSLLALDDSPHWYISRGRISQARKVLQKIYPDATFAQVDGQIKRIQESFATDTAYQAMAARVAEQLEREERPGADEEVGRHSLESSVRNLADGLRRAVPPLQVPLPDVRQSASKARGKISVLFSSRANRRALFLACGLQAYQQLCGFNSLMYFSGRLLVMVGFPHPLFMAMGIATANLIGTLGAIRFVDFLGRRKLMLCTTAAATVALAFLAISLGMLDLKDVADAPAGSGSAASPPEQPVSGWAYASLAGMVFFALFYALGLGIVPWLVQAEVFASPVRGIGGAFATATNWTSQLLVSATYLDMVKVISASGSFWLYAAITASCCVFTYKLLPELSGVSIDEAAQAFDSEEEARGAYTAVAS